MPLPTKAKILKSIGNDLTKGSRKGRSRSSTKGSIKDDNIPSKRIKKQPSKDKEEVKNTPSAVDSVISKDNIVKRLTDSFFDIPCIDLSKKLLGKILVRKNSDGSLMKGRIIETECYAGGNDKASCSFGGKETPKNKPTFMKPGTAFVYMTYGMYHCINISSQGDGAAVLLRAVEPIVGIDTITENRQNFGNKKDPNKIKQFKTTELCNGPSKLCIGFNIDKNTVNEKDLCSWNEMWIENDVNNASDIDDKHIVKTKRIGIDMVGEPWASKPLRFYIYELSLYVSKRDKKSEEIVEQNLKLI